MRVMKRDRFEPRVAACVMNARTGPADFSCNFEQRIGSHCFHFFHRKHTDVLSSATRSEGKTLKAT